ncbi:alpha/beta hydrolase [Paracoccus methylovorus]|uniref:Alpha/beta hydrolase n=1 Tax=Paracoccus methylovorus TaxID=2812658 RepID=A0ABX7JMC9_9RHOB|nr:alpha/beta hydrolase [Paracoccus methylovorus]QRZ15140.1 alpha/beta hydrolase [Paracoccus methylovorus]
MITDWTDAYANTPHIPDGAAFPARWAAEAAAFRARSDVVARLDLACGAAARLRADLFLPEGPSRGLVIFVHGGFWMQFGKDWWSHLAAGPLARGWAVAIPQYVLAPAARIGAITGQIAAALHRLAEEVAGPILLAGHSAGGQLVTRMVCRDVALPDRLRARIRHVLSISGLHDLRPLLRTDLNATLRLDPAEARAESPALAEPVPGTRLTTWVGTVERPEFIRQSALLANIWTGLGAETRVVEAPGRHHFDVVAPLADPDSPLCRALLSG